MLTVDDFLEQAGLSRSPIYHMVIDTEGHDALVLEGLKRTLSRRGVALLEFEVSWMDWWWSTAHHRRYKRTPRAEWRKFGSALRGLQRFTFIIDHIAGKPLIHEQ